MDSLCQKSTGMRCVLDQLGLTSSEEHIPQGNENTERAKELLVALGSSSARPRQARYQAALHPDKRRLDFGGLRLIYRKTEP